MFVGELLAPAILALVALAITAERSSLVENGGDSNGGWQDWRVTVILNGLPLVVLWTAGAFIGTKMRTRHVAR